MSLEVLSDMMAGFEAESSDDEASPRMARRVWDGEEMGSASLSPC